MSSAPARFFRYDLVCMQAPLWFSEGLCGGEKRCALLSAPTMFRGRRENRRGQAASSSDTDGQNTLWPGGARTQEAIADRGHHTNSPHHYSCISKKIAPPRTQQCCLPMVGSVVALNRYMALNARGRDGYVSNTRHRVEGGAAKHVFEKIMDGGG